MAPAVSIVIPTYNRAAFLQRALGTVLAQTRSDWDLVVVDDGSSDDTKGVVTRMGDARVRLLDNAGRKGAAGARNTGIAATTAPIVAFLDSDDSWEPHHLATILEHLAAHPEVAFVGADCWRIDRTRDERKTASGFQLELIGYWHATTVGRPLFDPQRLTRDPATLADRECVLSCVIGGFVWIQTSTVAVRRTALEAVGPFDESLRRTEDYDLWLRLNASHRLAFLPRITGEIDMTGQDEMRGDRYDAYEAARRTSEIHELEQHFDLLRTIADDRRRRARRWGELTPPQRAFLRNRMNYAQRMLAFLRRRDGSPRAAWHLIQAMRYRPKDFMYFLTKPREYLGEP
jgi:glycosyltransferase involved in cell wall biosynthesis